MVKTSALLLTSVILLSGCTREVYLQKVPCAEGDCECPYVSKMRDDCAETQALTHVIQYQVIDVPVVATTYVPYVPCCNGTTTTTTTTTTTRNCRTVCHEELVY